MQDWARAHVQSGVVVVCCCCCSWLQSSPPSSGQKTPLEPPSCCCNSSSSCVLRLADLACPFGHFRVHADKPSNDPLWPFFSPCARFSPNKTTLPSLERGTPQLSVPLCDIQSENGVFLSTSARLSRTRSSRVSVFDLEKEPAVGKCHAHEILLSAAPLSSTQLHPIPLFSRRVHVHVTTNARLPTISQMNKQTRGQE